MKNYEHIEERNRELLAVYKKVVGSVGNVIDVWRNVANHSTSRFFVSEERAIIAVSAMIRGEHICEKNICRNECYEEITKRAIELLGNNPNMSLTRACKEVLKQSAPKFYMSDLSVRETIYKMLRQRRKKTR